MSKIREIKTKISSIKNTQKITRAMELVAASKMRKAQERMAASKPYAARIRKVLRHVAAAHAEYAHPYLQARSKIKNIGYIVIGTDRGLCGGLNINLFRKLLPQMQAQEKEEKGLKFCLIGRKAELFFKRIGGNVLGIAEHLGDAPRLESLIGVIKILLDAYDQGEVDAIYLASNDFVNTMVQKPIVRQLLPLSAEDQQSQGYWDYIYEPDSAKELLTQLMIRYIESQVYQAVIENVACEQSARMVAMKSATENAGELIDTLQLIYNKARQASITREIAEIVGGAAAIE